MTLQFKRRENHRLIDGVVNFIITRKKLIEISFGILLILSAFCSPFVNTNYDLTKYLPDDTETTTGINIMKKEFGYPGSARVMVDHVTLTQAKEYKDKIAAVDGVDTVTWADSVTDIYQAGDFIAADEIKDYYKNGYSVMDITFKESDSSKRTSKAIDQIKAVIGSKGHMTGQAVQTKSLNENMVSQIQIAMIAVLLIIILITCVSTTSWFAPVLFLGVMGIAILINSGTNIFLGEISFMTASVSSILQLACSMDYSIFLLHAFIREKAVEGNPEIAMNHALKEAIQSIVPSAATTIVGFLALSLMKFSIGLDMGIVLAKGILTSMVTVLFLMPVVLLHAYKLVEKTTHRPFLPSFQRLGKMSYKSRYAILVLALLTAVPAYVGQGMNQFLYGNDSIGSSEGTTAYADQKAIENQFGQNNTIMILYPNTSSVKEKQMADELKKLDYTKSVTSLANELPEGIPESILPKSLTSELHTEKYARMIVNMNTASESAYAFQCCDHIRSIVKEYYPTDFYLVGTTPATEDMKSSITGDYSRVNLVSLLGVALIVMLSFQSLFLPILVLIPIEMAICINMFIPYLTGSKMIFMGYLIVSNLQLGATVDYSILMTNNYLSRRLQMGKKQAAIEAVTVSAPSILCSGLILSGAGFTLGISSTIAAVSEMGNLVGRGSLLSIIMVLFLLPSLLTLFDKPILRQQRKRQTRIQRADASMVQSSSAGSMNFYTKLKSRRKRNNFQLFLKWKQKEQRPEPKEDSNENNT